MTQADENRARLVRLGLDCIGQILTLQDRLAHSPTYGSFDRDYWHLRVKDFPSGMAQEFVLPLALVYAHPFEGNSFHGNETIREWIRAGIEYAGKSAHRDGSCDDYYPFERAAGATAFSQYAMLEALALTQLDPTPFMEALMLRGTWLAQKHESGRLSNHEALIANGLLKLAKLSGETRFRTAAEERVARLLSWQSDEGWFFEYQGCDPGYLTLTLGNMAEIDAQAPELDLRPAMTRAIDFLADIQPPDGWTGGEWTSRNTNNYFPHGLELCGAWSPKALILNDKTVASMTPAPEYRDDNIIAHHCWSYLKAALAWQSKRPAAEPQSLAETVSFPQAGIEIRRAGRGTLLAATKKGGSYRFYKGDTLERSDTGVSVQVTKGKKTCTLVCHLWNDTPEVVETAGGFTVSGAMGEAKQSLMSPTKMIILRLLMLSVGRVFPDLVRQALQALLITGNSGSGLQFERRFQITAEGLTVADKVSGPGEIVSAGIGPAQTSIYTVMSRVYHPPQLQPWEDLSAQVQSGSDLRLAHETRMGIDP